MSKSKIFNEIFFKFIEEFKGPLIFRFPARLFSVTENFISLELILRLPNSPIMSDKITSLFLYSICPVIFLAKGKSS